eukprot:gnl/Dysnectes_brevis/5563_a8059_422.p1 GENE.gnl/Dysnectes_brevis/5563_a8059_422~~gnl/Dysnectes_brevis/5563_a8059_422.p1  ORF type:complete len:711 (-),score=39.62 gnl/Dysnectes_brevis/5563_a8059_422:778-2910(-)
MICSCCDSYLFSPKKCVCGVLRCSFCSLEQKSCHICGSEDLQSLTSLEEDSLKNEYSFCPFCEITEISLFHSASHFKTCPYVVISCPECSQDIPRALMPVHRIDICPSHIVQCSLCDLEMERRQLTSHVRDAHMLCDHCGEDVLLTSDSDTAKHSLLSTDGVKQHLCCIFPKDSTCQSTPQSCVFTPGGWIGSSKISRVLKRLKKTAKITHKQANYFSQFFPHPVSERLFRGIRKTTGGRCFSTTVKEECAFVQGPTFTTGVHIWTLLLEGDVVIGVSTRPKPVSMHHPGYYEIEKILTPCQLISSSATTLAPSLWTSSTLFHKISPVNISPGLISITLDMDICCVIVSGHGVSVVRSFRPPYVPTRRGVYQHDCGMTLVAGILSSRFQDKVTILSCEHHTRKKTKHRSLPTPSQDPWDIVRCPFVVGVPSCDWHGYQHQLESHLTLQCSHRTVKCPNSINGCMMELDISVLPHHVLSPVCCGNICPECRLAFPTYNALSQHMSKCKQLLSKRVRWTPIDKYFQLSDDQSTVTRMKPSIRVNSIHGVPVWTGIHIWTVKWVSGDIMSLGITVNQPEDKRGKKGSKSKSKHSKPSNPSSSDIFLGQNGRIIVGSARISPWDRLLFPGSKGRLLRFVEGDVIQVKVDLINHTVKWSLQPRVKGEVVPSDEICYHFPSGFFRNGDTCCCLTVKMSRVGDSVTLKRYTTSELSC